MASSKKPQRVSDPAALVQHLISFLEHHTKRDQPVLLGLSGGLDSCVLLHLLVQAKQLSHFPFSVIHVNHQISPNADAWEKFCVELCTQHEVAFQAVKVDVPRDSGLGLEAAARKARYAALLAGEGDVLLAHHQDDQAETLLLQLLRGAGVNGLAAMPPLREEEGKRLLRPLLNVSRSQLLAYANTHHLRWIEDESNDSLHYDRNFLRHEVFPTLGKRFVGYRGTLARVASNLAEAAELLEQIALEDAAVAVQQEHLDIAWLKAATPQRAMNLLRWWIYDLSGLNPSNARLHEILNQLCYAKPNAKVMCRLGEFCLRRYRHFAYIDKAVEVQPYSLEWNGESILNLPDGRRLFFRETNGEGVARDRIKDCLRVTSRLEGASIRLDMNRPKRTLKNLWQVAAIPPWQRDNAVMFWHGDELVMVLGLGIDASWRAQADELGFIVMAEPNVDFA
ncbi:MAG: tRNA lysidine(34) synthetase TilS [Betaproteobacteria bacterium]|nr:tRNA lysidine(34) synthetase TilS [Betaproteobacteria bacterium]